MKTMNDNYLSHHGILGQKWGVRRYQNPDGTLTDAGKKRRNSQDNEAVSDLKKSARRTGKLAASSTASLALASAAAKAGITALQFSRTNSYMSGAGLYYNQAVRGAMSALKAGRVANNIGHMAGMLAGKSAFGETLVAAKLTAKAASTGASITSQMLSAIGSSPDIGNAIMTASTVAAGASAVGMLLTGVSVGVTAYKAGKAIKSAYDKHKEDKANNK